MARSECDLPSWVAAGPAMGERVQGHDLSRNRCGPGLRSIVQPLTKIAQALWQLASRKTQLFSDRKEIIGVRAPGRRIDRIGSSLLRCMSLVLAHRVNSCRSTSLAFRGRS